MSRGGVQVGPQVWGDRRSPSSEWKNDVLSYIEKATAAGEIVTVSSEPVLLTPSQVAEALGVSRPTISRRIADGSLGSVKVGSHHKIPYTEMVRFWREQMASVTALQEDDIWRELLA